MNFTSGLPVAAIVSALTWYGFSSSIRSAQTSSGSPIETQTSVSSTSQPRTASATSSVIVICAPVSAAIERASSTISSRGQSDFGLRDPDVHPELRAADQVRVRHVEAGVAEVAEDDLVERLGDVLAEGEEVGQDLGRVPLVGEPVVDRDAGPARELLGRVLREAAVLDRVVHAAEHARGVLHGLLVAHVRAGRADEGDVGALVVGGDLERAARPGRVLLEDQRDLLADELLLLAPLLLGRLQLRREVDQVA